MDMTIFIFWGAVVFVVLGCVAGMGEKQVDGKDIAFFLIVIVIGVLLFSSIR